MDSIKTAVRQQMRGVAVGLDKSSRGHISPNFITLAGFVAHLPIAVLIATDYLLVAGILLIFFGLFDTLDGELARVQGKTSAAGMFLDSVTDRLKEILLYVGIGWWAVYFTQTPVLTVLVVACAGTSILISYLNAWGEAVLSAHSKKDHAVNKTFRGGILGFEARMFLLVIGLITGMLPVALVLILAFGLSTLIVRFVSIMERPRRV